MRIARHAIEIKSAKLVLRVGVAEKGRCIGEHLTRARRVRHDRRIGNALQIVMPQRHECVGDDARLGGAGRLIRMRVGDLTEIAERALVALRNAIADRIHATDLPLCREMPLIGRILQRGQCFGLFAAIGRAAARTAQSIARREQSRARGARTVEGESRPGHNSEAKPANGGDHHAASGGRHYSLRCPHNTISRPTRPDG